MKKFLFASNPLNMGKREYWSVRSITTRMVSGTIIYGLGYLVYWYTQKNKVVIGSPTSLEEMAPANWWLSELSYDTVRRFAPPEKT